MIPFQIVAVSILVWFGFKQFLRFRKAPTIKLLYQLRWFFITVLATMLVIDPGLSLIMAKKLGVARGVDVVVYFALIWLLYQNYNLSQELDNIYQKLDELVRKFAINNFGGHEVDKKNRPADKGYKE